LTLAVDLFNIDAVCDKIISESKGYCPHKPHIKQKEFLELQDIEALYGGAAGGGKSDALLMGALEHVDKPGYSALLLRRTFRDLNQPKAIMDRAHDWLRSTDAKWNAQAKRYTFPKSGATLTFGYLDADKDKDQYASAEYHYIGFDELTQFPENWYRFMFSRLRREQASNIPVRMRGATNPGNIGHAWVRRRFVDLETREAPFISAKLNDNPFIDKEGYKISLSKLDKVTRDQLELGIWRNDASGLVYSFDRSKNLIQHAPKCQLHILGLDYGLTRDSCSFNVLGWNYHSPIVYVLKSWKKDKLVPSESADIAKQLNDQYRFQRIVGDSQGLGNAYVAEARRRFNLPVEQADKNNKRGYIMLYNGALEKEEVKIVESECKGLIDEYSELPWADDGRAKEAEGFDNHCADGTLYGWRACYAYMIEMGKARTGGVPSTFTKW